MFLCTYVLNYIAILLANYALNTVYNVDTGNCDSLYTAACEVVDNVLCTLLSPLRLLYPRQSGNCKKPRFNRQIGRPSRLECC